MRSVEYLNGLARLSHLQEERRVYLAEEGGRPREPLDERRAGAAVDEVVVD